MLSQIDRLLANKVFVHRFSIKQVVGYSGQMIVVWIRIHKECLLFNLANSYNLNCSALSLFLFHILVFDLLF